MYKRQLTPCIPNLLFEKKLTLRGTKREIEIHHLGGGHTVSDSIMYLPEDQIMFSGDLVLKHNHPWLGHGNPKKWLSILDLLNELEIRRIVPGHGPVATKQDLNVISEYIYDMINLVESLKKDGNTIEEALHTPIPQKYSEWYCSPVFEWNIRFLYEYLDKVKS